MTHSDCKNNSFKINNKYNSHETLMTDQTRKTLPFHTKIGASSEWMDVRGKVRVGRIKRKYGRIDE